MSLNFNAFASIDIYTFTTVHFSQFESSESLDLDILLCSQCLFYQVKHCLDKKLSFFLVETLLLAKQID